MKASPKTKQPNDHKSKLYEETVIEQAKHYAMYIIFPLLHMLAT